ncbi:MAG TPA: type II toxin-antitoxin system Phd/YefM family antitoxin [Pirellulaceae bacterium]|nr:type II toxin-antitoxin system Phd/YefM family antitoxin [Pirellulaceae bacterium]
MNMSIVELRDNLADTLNRIAYAGERIILERHGKPVAALVSMDDIRLIEQLEDESDVKAIRKARKQGGKPIPWEEAKRDLQRRKQ